MKLDDVRKLAQLEFPRTAEGQRKLHAHLRAMGIDPANLYQELEMSSPCVNTHRDVSYASATVSLHSHSYAELIYCRETAGIEYLIGSNRYRLQNGDVLFIPPDVSHRPLLPEQLLSPYVRDVIWISADFLTQLHRTFFPVSQLTPDDLAPLRTAGTAWEVLEQLFDNGVQEEQRKQPGWETAVLGNTMIILSYLQRVYSLRSAGTIRAEKPELTDRVTAYIERHFARSITIADLSKHFYVSESTISHQFRQKMGVSLYRYITQRRLIAAKARIQAGLPLEQVGRDVGFSDYSSFYRAFKQEFGISPRRYREIQSSSVSNTPE